jgi:hypothetical protein
VVVTISGAPGVMTAGTSVRLRANVPVAWSATAGTITPDGVFTAPLLRRFVLVRATAGDAAGEALVSVVPRPVRTPLPRACGGRVVRSAIGRLCVRRVRGRVLVSAVPRRSGALRIVVRRGSRVLKRCRWLARARRSYGCRFRIARGRRLSVTVTQRRASGPVLRSRLAVR